MDLDQFLEKDILTFLDGKMNKEKRNVVDREEEYGLYMTRDYIKELTKALENDELSKAKKLFDELKETYNHLPEESQEKKKIYALLEKMFEKIKNYVGMREKQNMLFDNKTIKLDKASIKNIEELLGVFNPKSSNSNKLSSTSVNPQIMKKFSKDDTTNVPRVIKKDNSFALLRKKQIEEDISLKIKEISELLEQHYVFDAKRKLISLKTIFQQYQEEYSDIISEDPHSSEYISQIKQEINNLQDKVSKLEIELLRMKEKFLKKSKESDDAENLIKKKQEFEKIENIKKQNEERKKKEHEALIKQNHLIEQKKINEEKKRLKNQFIEKTGEVSTIINHKKSKLTMHELVEELYEEGIYNMFQNNYDEALKSFEKILELKPSNKAAKIRVNECNEVLENAS